jgi:hypothetical protein
VRWGCVGGVNLGQSGIMFFIFPLSEIFHDGAINISSENLDEKSLCWRVFGQPSVGIFEGKKQHDEINQYH